MEITSEQWFFMAVFFSLWFIFSFIMLMLYAFWEERRKNKYAEFTVKDIFLGILFAPFTIICGTIYILIWFIMRVLHFEDLLENISDFMNKPLKLKRGDKNE